jgi:purine-binding chemotaxis protein CheW
VSDLSADLALICRVRTRLCALPLGHVQETLRPLPVEPVAGAPPFVLGLCVIRGAAVPVVDTAQLLGQASGGGSAAGEARFVTLEVEQRPVALAVDAVLGVRPVPAGTLQALPPLLQQAAGDVVAAIGRLDAQLLLVLRSARLLPQDARPVEAA